MIACAPARIQRSRARGWRMPAGAVFVGRPTRWGNPWRIVPVEDLRFPFGDAADVLGPNDASLGRFERITRSPGTGAPYWAVRQFRSYLEADTLPRASIEDVIRDLAGKDLACWCPLTDGQGNRVPCHADVLLEVANR